MRILPLPKVDAVEAFDACVASTGSVELQLRLIAAREELKSGYDYYAAQAEAKNLYSFHPVEAGDEILTRLKVSIGELKNLYTQQLSAKGRAPRRYYDKILASTPLGKCPLCGFGHASTLDHYLPKSKFPWYSVLPINLIPACKDCNYGKSNKFATIEAEQLIHPYFESALIGKDQWLFASVQPTSPASVVFFSEPPMQWDTALKGRVSRHFYEYDLPRRFAVEAATEIAGLIPLLSSLASTTGEVGVKAHLDMVSRSTLKGEANSWKTALYQALAGAEWYWKGGYLPLVT